MARTADQVIREILASQIVEIAVLTAKVEELEEKLARAEKQATA